MSSRPPSIRSLSKALHTQRDICQAQSVKLAEQANVISAQSASLEKLRASLRAASPEPLRPGIVACHSAVERTQKNPHYAWLVSFLKNMRNASECAASVHDMAAQHTNSAEAYAMLKESRARKSVITDLLRALAADDASA